MSFDEKMQAIRAGYLDRIGRRLGDVDPAELDDEAVRERVVAIAHDIAGTAGTLGHAEIGETARDLERVVGDGDGDPHRIRAGLATLIDQVERARQGR